MVGINLNVAVSDENVELLQKVVKAAEERARYYWQLGESGDIAKFRLARRALDIADLHRNLISQRKECSAVNNTMAYFNELAEKLEPARKSLLELCARMGDFLEINPNLVDEKITWLRELKYVPVKNINVEDKHEIEWQKEMCAARNLSYENLLSQRIVIIKRYLEELKAAKEVLERVFCKLINGLEELERRYPRKLYPYRGEQGELRFLMSLTPEGKEAVGKFLDLRKCCAALVEYLKWLNQWDDIHNLLKNPIIYDDETEAQRVLNFLHNAEALRRKIYQYDII